LAKLKEKDPYELWRQQALCWLWCWKKSTHIKTRVDKNIAIIIALKIPVDMSHWTKWENFGRMFLSKEINGRWSWKEIGGSRKQACKQCLRPSREIVLDKWKCQKGHEWKFKSYYGHDEDSHDIGPYGDACQYCCCCGWCDDCFRNKCKILNVEWIW
jgi:hypothetical protein